MPRIATTTYQKPERVVLDTSALLGPHRPALVAAADLRLFNGYWSSWIASEFSRLRTEWIAERAVREGCDRAELRRRLLVSRQRVNALVRELSHVLHSVDYAEAPEADLSWLDDPDDWPVMQTALAADADTLVTDNTSDFPPGEARCGVTFQTASGFLTALCASVPDAEAAIQTYLRARPPQSGTLPR